jgi:hypothetical protein
MGNNDPYGSDNNFGYVYTPGLIEEYSHQSQDPAKAFYSGTMSPDQRIPTFTTTDFSRTTTTEIATLIYRQHDGPYRQASLTWYRICLYLGGIKAKLNEEGGKLANGWDPAKNDAAANFFHFVGASTWSIDEWITFAIQNRDATLNVANAINKARTEMATLWSGYLKDYVGLYNNPSTVPVTGNIYEGTPIGPDGQPMSDDQVQKIKNKYDDRARGIIKELADTYAGNWFALNEGHKFQGPTNAVSPGKAIENRKDDLMANLTPKLPGGGTLPSGVSPQQIAAIQAQLDQQLALQKQAMEDALHQAQLEEQARLADLQQQQQQALNQIPTFAPIPVGQPGPSGVLPPGALPTFGLGQLPGGAGPATAGLRGPGGLGNFDLSGEEANLTRNNNGLLGRSGLPGAGGMPGMPGGPGAGRGFGNPGLRGRMGGPGQPGMPGGPGSRGLGGRRDREGDRDPGRAAGFVRPESEEYLADTPTAPGQLAARMAGDLSTDGLTPPPGGLPGAGVPGGLGGPGRPGIPAQRGGPGTPGFPGQPGVPGSGGRGRPMKPEDLAGRRQREIDSELDEDLMAPPLLLRPDLTGRKGIPVIDWDQVAGAEMGAERAMLGSRGAPAAPSQPGMADRLSGRRKDKEREQTRPEQERTEDAAAENELWTVERPETIEAPTETKVDDQRGKTLGAN